MPISIAALVNYVFVTVAFSIYFQIITEILEYEGLLVRDEKGMLSFARSKCSISHFCKMFADRMASRKKRKTKLAKLAHVLRRHPLSLSWHYTVILSIVILLGATYGILSYGSPTCLFATGTSVVVAGLWYTMLRMRRAYKVSSPSSTESFVVKGHHIEVTDDNALEILSETDTDEPLPFTFVLLRFILLLIVCVSPFAMFFATASVVSARQTQLYDEYLLRGDEFFLGRFFPMGQVALWLDQHPFLGPTSAFGRFLNDVLTVIYCTFFAWPVVGLLYMFLKSAVQERMAGPRHERAAWSITESLACTWVIAFFTTIITNAFVPAKSPRLYLKDEYVNSIENTWLRKFLEPIIHQDGTYGSFPSGHVGETLCVGVASLALHVWPKMAKANIVFSLLVALATLWLRYHYFVDVLAAFGVCLFALFASGATKKPDMDCLAHIPALPPERAPLSFPEEIISRILGRKFILFKRIPSGMETEY